jgi:hypothetical protein
VEFEIDTDSQIRSAVVDPQHKILLDINVINNGMAKASQDALLFKLSSKMLFVWEMAIQWLTAF